MQSQLTLVAARRGGRGRRIAPAAIAAADTCFERALAIARDQQARSLELRAAVSLARLRSRGERRAQAAEALAALYAQFSEGFDSADLVDARALLDELSDRRQT